MEDTLYAEREVKWLSVAEAARIQGMTAEGLLRRIKRGAVPEPFLWRCSENYFRLRSEYVHWPNLAEEVLAEANRAMAELQKEFRR